MPPGGVDEIESELSRLSTLLQFFLERESFIAPQFALVSEAARCRRSCGSPSCDRPFNGGSGGGYTILRVAGCRHRSGQDRGLSSQLLTPDRYDLEVSRPTQRRRRLQALVLAAVAIGLVIVEPFPKGALLVSLTPTHGADVGDLPALALLLVAACLAI
jgi:hypothetical protein